MFDYLIVIDQLNNWYVEPLNDADYPPKAFGGILGCRTHPLVTVK